MTGQHRRAATVSRPILALAAAAVVALALIQVQVVGTAFWLTGLSPAWAVTALVGGLLGSAVDVPVARIRTADHQLEFVSLVRWGEVYLVPVVRRSTVVVAVNLGGALVPAVVSGYLLLRTGQWADATIAVLVVAAVAHQAARPAPGVGVLLPVTLPAVVAAGVALIVAPSVAAPAVAYVGGTIGTVLGADLTNLGWLRHAHASAVSIGGAGTFDAVFVAGVLGVLLTALVAGVR
ncbi:MAG: DUF1614 domain-containing protein [Kineosporiaceae bacterium]